MGFDFNDIFGQFFHPTFDEIAFKTCPKCHKGIMLPVKKMDGKTLLACTGFASGKCYYEVKV